MARGKRSRKYPFIPLDKALARVDQLYREEGRNFTPMKVAVSHWGYKPKSSGGIQTVAALIGFGLLEDKGSGPEREVRVAELARRILLDQRPESNERLALIREAALTPDIFSELWARWKESGVPSHSSMRHTLVFEYDFNENTVDDFIRIFIETIEFAALTQLDRPEGLTEDRTELSLDDVQVRTEGPPVKMRPVAREPEPNMNESTFPLAEGLAVVQWPTALSPESYEDFEAWVHLTLRRAKRSIVEPEQKVADDESGDEPE